MAPETRNETDEPKPDQLMAMAYVDGELEESARREFERQLASRPDLAREVAQLRRLEVAARHMAGPEPADHEWSRLRREALHTGGTRLGLGLMLAGVLAAVGWLGWTVATDPMPLVPKLALLGLLGGGTIVFFLVLRARLRTLPYDPYTEIER